ncbi:MAG: hypothetical protein WD772_06705 [Pseudohongiellaceae bacterium]
MRKTLEFHWRGFDRLLPHYLMLSAEATAGPATLALAGLPGTDLR